MLPSYIYEIHERMTTLILGASEHTHRYSYKAAQQLTDRGHSILMLGKQAGQLFGRPIHTSLPDPPPEVHTVTMYLAPHNQDAYRRMILDLQPSRVIFNPGTEYPDFMKELAAADIEVVPACTLVLLSIGAY